MASMVEHGSAINHSVEKARKRTSRRRGLILNELLSGVTTAAIIVIALTGLGTGRHYSGSADPGECAGHGGHFKARRSWTAWRQIRADRNPIRQHRARDQNPSERQPERRTGTPRQQIRADGTPLHFREMTAGSLPFRRRGIAVTGRDWSIRPNRDPVTVACFCPGGRLSANRWGRDERAGLSVR